MSMLRVLKVGAWVVLLIAACSDEPEPRPDQVDAVLHTRFGDMEELWGVMEDGRTFSFARDFRLASLSPDRRRVQLVLDNDDVQIVRVRGGQHTLDVWAFHRMVWSPDGSQLAWPVDNTVLIGDADGQQPTTITLDFDIVQQLVWHPDGTFLAIGGGEQLVIVDTDTLETVTVPLGGDPRDIVWSPARDLLAVHVQVDSALNVMLIALDGSVRSTTPDAGVSPVGWSADGAWYAAGLCATEITLIQAAGGEPQRIEGSACESAWAPNAPRLVFRAAVYMPLVGLPVAVWSPDGITTLATPAEGTRVPRWSPDGSLIAVEDVSGYVTRFYDRVTGAEQRQVDGLLPRWNADGTHLLTHGPDMIVADADGTSPRIVADYAPYSTWLPSGDRIAFYRRPTPTTFEISTTGLDETQPTHTTTVPNEIDSALFLTPGR